MRSRFFVAMALPSFLPLLAAAASLPGTAPLLREGDYSEQMVAGIQKFLLRETENSVTARGQFWKRDRSSPEAYAKSVEPNRQHLAQILGVVDQRAPFKALEHLATSRDSAVVAETPQFKVIAVRWPVLDGVTGEGLLLEPKSPARANVIALPDADQTPEQLAGVVAAKHPWARSLAAAGCRVIIPSLIDRRDEWSGNPRIRFTNQPHREWIYRQAFMLGRTLIGYEVQKVLALADWLTADNSKPETPNPKLLVAGYGEGGLLALHAAALDQRISAALVSGYFDSRQALWKQPIYRNVFGLLREFGDAELASLIHPRALVIEHSVPPEIAGPPAARANRAGGAAPGKITLPDLASVQAEAARAGQLTGRAPEVFHGNGGATTGPGSIRTLEALLQSAGVTARVDFPPEQPLGDARKDFSADDRQRRQVKELEGFTQNLLRVATYTRDESFWAKAKVPNATAWETARKPWHSNFWHSVIGKLPSPSGPANARSKEILNTEKLTGYDVMLDVQPDVFAWGILLLPKDLKPGERRPVVVCQHGLEGVPMDTVTTDEKSRAWQSYKGFATRLTERGFIVFAPHNPYRGRDEFRAIQRLANPLGTHLFSVIFAQHERILEWLGAQPFVDKSRIAFYGLSYGGKSAMRIPAALDGYCLSICSADFNEWVWKNATVDWRGSYLFTGEYEIFEWNLGHTFNYAEMAALIAPRPFMVERGHDDGVGIDEWVNFEFAKIRRFYTKLGIGDRTEIEHFDGPHTINGQGTFDFLHKHLNWPKR
ncbi:MAG: alpha/beta hydrolase family protein [Limisphaerales bacterium]